jgi:hypothetical protein
LLDPSFFESLLRTHQAKSKTITPDETTFDNFLLSLNRQVRRQRK